MEKSGKAKGGLARAASLSSERRREIAEKASAAAKVARNDSELRATHGREENPKIYFTGDLNNFLNSNKNNC